MKTVRKLLGENSLSIFSLCCMVLCLSLVSCRQIASSDGEEYDKLISGKENKALLTSVMPVSLLQDKEFRKGLTVLHPTSGDLQGGLQYPGGELSPKWKLSQWYSTSSLYGASPVWIPSGACHFADNNKAITLSPQTTSSSDIIFAINGQHEFGNVYRPASDPFPHLIVDQKIADPDGWLGTSTPFIGELDSLVFQIEANLLYHVRNQKSGYNSAIHALQFSNVFLIQNLRAGSPGYGKAMYFLVMLFDDRYTLPGLSITEDIFSGQFIYDIGLAPFSQSGMSVGQWKRVRGNLLPFIKQGLNEAWNRGFLGESRSYNDYKVSLFTMGFECTGLNIGTMQVKNLLLEAYK